VRARIPLLQLKCSGGVLLRHQGWSAGSTVPSRVRQIGVVRASRMAPNIQ